MTQSRYKRRTLYLLDILFFSLVVIAELPRIYLFSRWKEFLFFLNILQVPLYLGLIYIIINQKYTIKQIIFFVFIGVLLLIGYAYSGQAAFFRALLLIFAARNVSFKRILRVCRMAITCVFTLAIVLWIARISDAGVQRRGYVAFGYVHPNIVAQVVMIITLLWITEKAEYLKRQDYIIIEFVAITIFLLSGSRTGALILAITPAVLYYTKKLMEKDKYKKLPLFLLESSQILLFGFTYFTAIYLPNSSFLKTLDLVFTNRLFLNYYQFAHNSITLFGQKINLTATGVYNNIQNVWGAVVTCDCTYVMSLLVMGVIPTLFFILGYILVIKKGIKERNYVIISTGLVLAVYSFFEVQMLEIYNNFIYFYIFANYLSKNKLERKELVDDT